MSKFSRASLFLLHAQRALFSLTAGRDQTIPLQAYQQANTKGKSAWVSIQQLGTTLQQLQPGFASKTYGFSKLKGLIQSYPQVFQTRALKGG